MCRFLAYRGEPVLIETLVCTPCHSLIQQSMHAVEGKTEINGDGFGIGWYGERPEPGTYRELRPAWSDENLQSLCAQVRSGLFFAHVRAATGTATTRANCHPFSAGRFLFMHNGQVGSFAGIRRRIEALIPDSLYHERAGTTDSEAMFLAALGMGAAEDPMEAVSRMLLAASAAMRQAAIATALRFTAALTDGRDLWAFRWASDGRAPTLYYRHGAGGLVVVSEPIDQNRPDWHEVPQGHCLVAAGDTVRVEPMSMELAAAA